MLVSVHHMQLQIELQHTNLKNLHSSLLNSLDVDLGQAPHM